MNPAAILILLLAQINNRIRTRSVRWLSKRRFLLPQLLQVKINSRNQITLPSRLREQLIIRSGDRLLVDVQDGVMILVRQPVDYAAHLSGLHKEDWQEVDPETYLREEREA